jgi:hypothetical protein
VLVSIRPMSDTALKTRGRVADALRGLAAALTESFALRRPRRVPRWEPSDDIAWGLSDIAETLTRLEARWRNRPNQ